MELHFFGAATAAGRSFMDLYGSTTFDGKIFAYSRSLSPPSSHSYFHEYCYLDLDSLDSFVVAGNSETPKSWVSFAPIWKLAPYIERLATHHP